MIYLKIKKFVHNIEKSKDDLYFLYGGNIIDENLTIEQLINIEDKNRNKMNITVIENINTNYIENKTLTKIKCSKCKENITLLIDDKNIIILDTDDTDNIEKENMVLNDNNNGKTKCGSCQKSNKNNFNFCFSCRMNLCSSCFYSHNKLHNVLSYNKENYICESHHES